MSVTIGHFVALGRFNLEGINLLLLEYPGFAVSIAENVGCGGMAEEAGLPLR